ncbi:MAG: hypothetical protein H0V96_05580, partial [Acidimicrobiia bacterium]|nr:hypothetical protein [Acidimicrobiia bacterium]
MGPMDRNQPEIVERLAPTGTRLPVWYRLPDQPPLAAHEDPYPDDPYSDQSLADEEMVQTATVEADQPADRTAVIPPLVIPPQVEPGPYRAAPPSDRRRGSWL